MTIPELYNEIHGDYAEAKTRLMSDRLIDKFVLKFPADPTAQELTRAVDAKDVPTAFRAAHTLKGVAANLAFTELAARASELTEQLRPGPDAVDETLYERAMEAYTRTIAAIGQYEQSKT